MKIVFTFLAIFLFLSKEGMTQHQEYLSRVIAHRGAWKNTGAPENSIDALQHAITLGCYGSEFDVHMSADSVLFVHHDPVIQGVSIEKTTAAGLSVLKLANGESLPTLEAYLKAGALQKHVRLILEIKASQISKERSLALAEKCVELVKHMNVYAITDYISFDYDVCKKVKSLDPSAHVAYLNGEKAPEELAAAGLDMDYHFSIYKSREAWIDGARENNLTTNVWTVNDKETMLWFLDRQVDFITTNEPELLIELLEKR